MAEVTLDQFRAGLEEALAVLKRLGTHCRDVDELTGLIELAVGPEEGKGNAAQLKILMGLVFPPQQQANRR